MLQAKGVGWTPPYGYGLYKTRTNGLYILLIPRRLFKQSSLPVFMSAKVSCCPSLPDMATVAIHCI